MYEQRDVPVLRRVIRILIIVLVVIVVLSLITWAVFFRGKAATKPVSLPTVTHQSTTKPKPTSSGTNGVVATPDPAESSTPAATTPAPQSTQLVNTGAGDVVPVFVGAALTGAVIYHVTLRRKAAKLSV